MKGTRVICALFLAWACLSAAAEAETAYYYFHNEPVPLTIDSTQVFIKFEGYSPDEGQSLLMTKYPQLSYDPARQVSVEGFGVFDLGTPDDYDSLVADLRANGIVRAVNPVIAVTAETPMYIGETFICKFAPFITGAEIDSLAAAYHLIVGSENEYMPGEYVLKTTKQTGCTTVEIANLFNNLEQTVYSHPNFYAWVVLDGYTVQDEYYQSFQNNIKKVVGLTGSMEGAWEITTGSSNVYIAVVDQGIGPHEDLDSTHFTFGYDFIQRQLGIWTLPSEATHEVHGMEVGGLILAKHNNLVSTSSIGGYPEPEAYCSIAGLVPDCHAYSIRIMDTLGRITSADTLGRALGFAFRNCADVINCSWTYFGAPVESINDPIDSAFQYGRGGLGSVIVFSAGNASYLDSTVRWPKTKGNVLAVGAIKDADDGIFPYSCHGPSVDLVAHSGEPFFNAPGNPYQGGGIWSLDAMDSAGYNPLLWDGCGEMNDVDYVCTFSGTSAAAPLVTGTAALIISRRPDLTAAQVMDVLKYSAITDLQWGTITPPDTFYGYGRVNALRALVAVSRGDANNDKQLNIGDAVHIINYIYRQGPAPSPHPGMADANCDGKINIGDPVYLVTYIYRGGPAPGICYYYDY